MATIRKKVWPQYFDLIKSRKKNFELRLADFKVRKGDTLILEEWNPKKKEYTGRKIKRQAKYILKFKLNDFGQEKQIADKGFYIIQL
jgi:ASC-1-like (ASCH) protein